MSSDYVFEDPLTSEKKVFFGYLFDCRKPGLSPCTYKMQIDNRYYCNHPNSRSYQCGEEGKGKE